MTKHFQDEEGRRWKAWLASRDVFWPDPATAQDDTVQEGYESVIFVCFSDPNQPQRRARIPSGSFETLSKSDLRSEFGSAVPDSAIG